MVHTNFEEMQKLGEKLETLTGDARPMLKDLQIAIKQFREIEKHVTHVMHITMDKAKEASETYKLCKEMDKIIAHKLHTILDNAKMVDQELRRLQELHLMLQKDIQKSLQEIPKITGGL